MIEEIGSTSIEIQETVKPKRKYVRKPKVVVPDEEHAHVPEVVDIMDINGVPVEIKKQILSKNEFNKVIDEHDSVHGSGSWKHSMKHLKDTNKAPVPEAVVPEVVVPQVGPALDGPVPEPTKKPRSQKQLDAFNRMREARLKKSAELQELKAFEKEKQLFEKEQLKVEKMEKKIVRKVTGRSSDLLGAKTKSPPPAPPAPVPAPVPATVPQPILIHRPQVSSHPLVPFKETNVRPILFV